MEHQQALVKLIEKQGLRERNSAEKIHNGANRSNMILNNQRDQQKYKHKIQHKIKAINLKEGAKSFQSGYNILFNAFQYYTVKYPTRNVIFLGIHTSL